MNRRLSFNDVVAFFVWTGCVFIAGAFWEATTRPEPHTYRVVHEYRMPVRGWTRDECLRTCTAQHRMAAVVAKETP